jgi:predicted ester cyclase
VLSAVRMLEHYVGWMQGLYEVMPDASYEVRSFAVDDDRGNAMAFGVFRGTHTGEGGPVPPTGKSVEAEYVYIMEFEMMNSRIKHMTKVWNDGFSMQQLGWG